LRVTETVTWTSQSDGLVARINCGEYGGAGPRRNSGIGAFPASMLTQTAVSNRANGVPTINGTFDSAIEILGCHRQAISRAMLRHE